MDRKLFGLFSGTHVTVMFVAAMAALVPGVLRAVDSYTNVAIEDPVNGSKAHLDKQRRLYTFDDSYAQQPANFVAVVAPSNGSTFYTVPSGKALIVQAMTSYLHSTSAGADDEQDLMAGGGNFVAAAVSDGTHTTVAQTFGRGIAVPSGAALSLNGFDDKGSASIYGYLVPASELPPGSSALNGVRESNFRSTRWR